MIDKLKNLDDESLMEHVKKHDHQAFSILVERHSDKFYASSYRIVMNKQEAEDIVQDAFLKLWDRPDIWKTGKGAKFTSWFYKIVMNLSFDRHRKFKNVKNLEDKEQNLGMAAEQYNDLQKNEEQIALDHALKLLPEKQLQALNLCFYEDISRKEAADIMSVSVKALESLLMRAKEGIRNELHRQGFLEEKNKKGQKA